MFSSKKQKPNQSKKTLVTLNQFANKTHPQTEIVKRRF